MAAKAQKMGYKSAKREKTPVQRIVNCVLCDRLVSSVESEMGYIDDNKNHAFELFVH